mmetsp:Transcript_70804/g.121588  ORF Transcript_70804/g.121588 Transcript_70804/m.121588 type:complete len:202 (-) Transcript_70804:709-1314(-)
MQIQDRTDNGRTRTHACLTPGDGVGAPLFDCALALSPRRPLCLAASGDGNIQGQLPGGRGAFLGFCQARRHRSPRLQRTKNTWLCNTLLCRRAAACACFFPKVQGSASQLFLAAPANARTGAPSELRQNHPRGLPQVEKAPRTPRLRCSGCEPFFLVRRLGAVVVVSRRPPVRKADRCQRTHPRQTLPGIVVVVVVDISWS